MQIQLSEVQVVPVKAQDGLVGFASLVYDNNLYLGSIGIFTRPQGGYRLTYPTRKGTNGNFNVFHPINRQVSDQIEQAIISKFEEVTNQYVRHDSTHTQ